MKLSLESGALRRSHRGVRKGKPFRLFSKPIPALRRRRGAEPVYLGAKPTFLMI